MERDLLKSVLRLGDDAVESGTEHLFVVSDLAGGRPGDRADDDPRFLEVVNLVSKSLMIRGDSTHTFLPISRLDAVSTDVPYGRASSTRGKNTGTIIREFLSTLAETLANDGSRELPKYAVIMRPSSVELEVERKSFEIEEEHHIYVHRNLTRAINVLRRL